MRDILVIAIVMAGCLAALRRPWIGIMLWTWLSIMNPHRYTYGIAYSAPLAATAVASVVLGLLMSKERESPFKGGPVTWFTVFILWITLSWLAGIDPAGDYDEWKKVMKIDVMIFLALILLRSKQHIFALVWVAAGSIALIGIKGGIFTLRSGGSERVWGPPGSFIEGNNELALALVVIIPLLRFLQLQLSKSWARHAMSGAMLLCAVAALGSQSRGALLAIAAMALYFFRNSKNKLGIGFVLIITALALLAFMPDTWFARMNTMNTYEQDSSAMGRINAWWSAWNSAQHYPFGVGFNGARQELFDLYSPNATDVLAAHSIYFQVLGNHGFIGLFIFFGIFVATWRSAGWLQRQKGLVPEADWTKELGAMCQVALVGYAVGGAFLSLAYFDLPYDIMAMVVLTRVWIEKKSWLTEPTYPPGWKTVPGLATRIQAN